MAERVVITGGAGFIGSHLARRCVAEGLDVHLFVRPSSSLHRLAGEIDRLTIHTADLGDEPRLRALLARIAPDRVFHLAARTRGADATDTRSEEHTSELQSLMRISYAVFCLQKKKNIRISVTNTK